MYFASTMKSVVFIVALATQCVSAELQNGYLDKKFYVLTWITYLKHLSLIALMLCVVVLYYVPQSRSHARRICCTLIDLIANGLKFIINVTEPTYELERIKVIDRKNLNEEPKIHELYRKMCKESTRIKLRHYDEVNIDDNSKKSIRRQQRRKSDANHSVEKKRKYHQRRNHHRNVEIKNISSESDAVNNSSQRKTITNKKCEKDNIIIPMNTSSKAKIMTCNTMMDKMMENSTDLRQEEATKNRENYITKNRTESSSYKKITSSNTIPETKSKIEYGSIYESSNHRDCSYDSGHLLMAKARYERAKPVLLRVVNWLFGGCPEASRRHRGQVKEVGKEETFESTNMWLLYN